MCLWAKGLGIGLADRLAGRGATYAGQPGATGQGFTETGEVDVSPDRQGAGIHGRRVASGVPAEPEAIRVQRRAGQFPAVPGLCYQAVRLLVEQPVQEQFRTTVSR